MALGKQKEFTRVGRFSDHLAGETGVKTVMDH